MKFKIKKRTIETVETNLELPLYLYFQGELMEETYYKIAENGVIKISLDFFGAKIETMEEYFGEDFDHLNNITTEEDFKEVLGSVIDEINNI